MEQFGPYELKERIAVGGMAEIFLARRRGPGGFAKRVALKRVLPELAQQDEFRHMFADEARLCASLTHPGLVQVFDYGEVDDTPYLAMEWVNGCDLASMLTCSGPIRSDIAAYMMAEIARTLSYVHNARDERGQELHIVHRDLSPGNILISREGNIKLGDFGVAKARGRLARTQAGQLKGTLAYLAPEQVCNCDVDLRSDVYALGLLLFELVTGERFIEGQSEVELLKAAAHPEFRKASSILTNIDPAIDDMLIKALAIEPQRRYPNAEAFELDARKISVDPSEAREFIENKVLGVVGGEGKRRQTEMVCVDPNEKTRKKLVLPILGASLIGLCALSVGWYVLRPAQPADDGLMIVSEIQEQVPPRKTPLNVDAFISHETQEDSLIEPASTESETTSDQQPTLPAKTKSPSIKRNGPIRVVNKTTSQPSKNTEAIEQRPEQTDPPVEQQDDEPPTEPERPTGPDLSALMREADRFRGSRGIVPGDDQNIDRLRRQAAQLISGSAPSDQSARAIEAYRSRVESVNIDRRFIDEKMRRVSRRIESSNADGQVASELSALSRQALRRAMAGDYEGANRLLNQILQQLRRR